jgi:hypothetical protein
LQGIKRRTAADLFSSGHFRIVILSIIGLFKVKHLRWLLLRTFKRPEIVQTRQWILCTSHFCRSNTCPSPQCSLRCMSYLRVCIKTARSIKKSLLHTTVSMQLLCDLTLLGVLNQKRVGATVFSGCSGLRKAAAGRAQTRLFGIRKSSDWASLAYSKVRTRRFGLPYSPKSEDWAVWHRLKVWTRHSGIV